MGSDSAWDLIRNKPKEIPKKYSSYDIDNMFEEVSRQNRISKRTEQVQKIEQIMARIGEIERKMQKGENYFSLYYDLKKHATKFLELYSELEGQKISVDDLTYKKIMAMKERLERRTI